MTCFGLDISTRLDDPLSLLLALEPTMGFSFLRCHNAHRPSHISSSLQCHSMLIPSQASGFSRHLAGIIQNRLYFSLQPRSNTFYFRPSTMVFLASRKRATSTKGRTVFATLPDELLLEIVGNLETPAVLNLRSTHGDFVGACNEALATRCNTLYLHPSKTSLRQSVDICEHPFFSKSITELVVLGKTVGPGIPQNHAKRQSSSPEAGRGSMFPWPSTALSRRLPAPQPETGRREGDLEAGYQELFNAIVGLPYLCRLSYSGSTQKPGWNQTAQSRIESHAKTCAAPVTAWQERRYTDGEVLFHLLGALGPKVNSLDLDTEFPCANPTTKHPKEVRNVKREQPLLSLLLHRTDFNLTSCSLMLHIGNNEDQHVVASGLLNRARSSLRSLKITLKPQHARAQKPTTCRDILFLSVHHTSHRSGSTCQSSTHGRSFAKLESLTLHYCDPPTPAKCKKRNRRVRPSCQVLDLKSLLRNVRSTIKSVTIRNIIVSPNEHGDSRNPRHTHAPIDQMMKEDGGAQFPQLEHFEWHVNRYWHDPRCRSESEDTAHGDCVKYSCGFYLPASTLQSYEMTAQRLAVDFITEAEGHRGEKFGYWDFGSSFMRDRRQLAYIDEGCNT